MKVIALLDIPTDLFPGEIIPDVQMDSSLGGNQSLFVRCRKERYLCTLLGIKPRLCRAVHSLVTVLAEITRHIKRVWKLHKQTHLFPYLFRILHLLPFPPNYLFSFLHLLLLSSTSFFSIFLSSTFL
jgi:hypothetical protein